MVKRAQILTIGFLLLGGFTAPEYGHASNGLATLDWSIKTNPSLAKNPPAQEDTRKFINELLNAEITNPVLCSYKFLDIAGDGAWRLAATLDHSGRHYCNEMVVIGKKGSGFTIVNKWDVWGVNDIGKVLRDVDNDGRSELVVPQGWTLYEGGAHCLATWQKIFQWKNDKFIDNSNAFPTFYRIRLQELKTGLERSMGYGPEAVCQQMEVDKINRFLGTEPRAGFARAEDWMKGPDASLRRKAAAVFADIKDEESLRNLATLTQDSDAMVAETARLYMTGGK